MKRHKEITEPHLHVRQSLKASGEDFTVTTVMQKLQIRQMEKPQRGKYVEILENGHRIKIFIAEHECR